MAAQLWMLGHSNRSFLAFVDLLHENHLRRLIDVRSYPASRRHPQFDRLQLERRLPPKGVEYAWMPDLGGMRQPVVGLRCNAAWKEPGFRAYADHMQSTVFQESLAALLQEATQAPTAVMCAEALYLKCHRQLLADAALARGWQVWHVVAAEDVRPHRLTPTAHLIEGEPVTYPETPQLPF